MGSSYFGEPSLGNGRAGGSSRKNKKTNSDKPKQPQRGLGVAQLEKIRLHNQMNCNYLPSLHNPYHTHLNQEEEVRLGTTFTSAPSSSSSFPYSSSSAPLVFHQNFVMGMGEMEARDFRYGDSQYSNVTARGNNNGISEMTQYSMHPTETRHLMNQNVEDSLQKKRRKDRRDSMGSSSQNLDSNDQREIDLELKL
ncbi:protein SPEAR3-like [Macadamia integrifolia]|uniref:protein SPEAR3-like n=1 Tax=Macadamia integrifolia TaxID=60698 RepID=UPI001C4EA204|nr:protein SPEAR3-like [Macadamia integrifolia]